MQHYCSNLIENSTSHETDHRQQDREVKLLVDCTPTKIDTAHGFINYDRTLLEGVLVLRDDMLTLWGEVRPS